MDHVARLKDRLEALGVRLSQRSDALCLLALGSAGREQMRLDRFSDLDFFVIVAPGAKAAYLSGLEWLSALAPVAFSFANTVDGFRLLFQDGVFCEFAVFEPHELSHIPFAPGRIVWRRAGFDVRLVLPKSDRSGMRPRDRDWLIGEILCNLYVGMGRECRGEHLAAMKMIQGYALDHCLMLMEQQGAAQAGGRDPFSVDRRFERRFPQEAQLLPLLAPGYAGNTTATEAFLSYLEQRFAVNRTMVSAIRDLCRLSRAGSVAEKGD